MESARLTVEREDDRSRLGATLRLLIGWFATKGAVNDHAAANSDNKKRILICDCFIIVNIITEMAIAAGLGQCLVALQ